MVSEDLFLDPRQAIAALVIQASEQLPASAGVDAQGAGGLLRLAVVERHPSGPYAGDVDDACLQGVINENLNFAIALLVFPENVVRVHGSPLLSLLCLKWVN